METVRGILAAHPSGISRAGILAWAQLRIDPDFDEARLDADLAALGAEVVGRDGFLWLSSSGSAPRPTPEPTPASMPWEAPSAAESAAPDTPVAWQQPASPSQVGADGIDGWRAPGGTAQTPPAAGSWTTDGGTGAAVPGASEWTPPGRRARTGGWIFGLAVAAIIIVSNLVGFLAGDQSSDTPVPTIIVIAGLFILLTSFAEIKSRPFQISFISLSFFWFLVATINSVIAGV